MNGITFTTRHPVAGLRRVRESSATLPTGEHITIGDCVFKDGVQLSLHGEMTLCYMVFSAAQARSVAAELLACADEFDSVKAGA